MMDISKLLFKQHMLIKYYLLSLEITQCDIINILRFNTTAVFDLWIKS